ncbi:hypothetical protein EV121DRAFT_266279 [Schizophyllum commune]
MSYQHALQTSLAHGAPANEGPLRDIWETPAWREMQTFLRSPYHLVFSIYIDWFNPFTNKIAGLTPPPHAPSFITIAHILDTFVDSLLPFSPPGQRLPTFHHPEGVTVTAKAPAVIADLQASKKTTAFTSPVSKWHCTYCTQTLDELEDLALETWQLRDGGTVRNQAEVWLSKTTKSQREEEARQTGVRWTPLYRLDYYNPVKHVILGIMHNWMEGILQHHLRDLWGIGRDVSWTAAATAVVDSDERWTEADVSESADELHGLEEEERGSASGTLSSDLEEEEDAIQAEEESLERLRSRTTLPSTSQPLPRYQTRASREAQASRSSSPSSLPSDYTEEDAGSDVDMDDRSSNDLSGGSATPTGMAEGSGSVTPTQINPYHHDHDSDSDEEDTDFVPSAPSESDVFAFTPDELASIRQGIRDIMRPSSMERPPVNLGEASHGKLKAQLLKYWGPLAALSEFPGERMNGMLQKVKTNQHLGG